jgi:putative transposase
MPFPVRAIQVDGGSKFQDAFEAECEKRGINLFVLPPRSTRLNGHAERAQRTHTEEFYELTDSSFDIAELNKALRTWEHVYDTVRPHQSLGIPDPTPVSATVPSRPKGVDVSLMHWTSTWT